MKGFRPSDRKDFDDRRMPVLSRACHELSWLLDRDYPTDTARDFVGDRYQLTSRQRLLLARVVSGDAAARRRAAKRVGNVSDAGGRVSVDGFNAIVTLEVALAGGPVVACQDKTVRDLAGMRGTYHPSEETDRAIRLLFDHLGAVGATDVDVRIDGPVSNSGRLRALVLEAAEGYPALDVHAELDRDVDAVLASTPDVVVTTDSVILDKSTWWLNAVAEVLEGIDGVWMIRPMELRM